MKGSKKNGNEQNFHFRHIDGAGRGTINCPSKEQAGLFATGEIRQNIKFAAFWCVLLTKIKVDPESW